MTVHKEECRNTVKVFMWLIGILVTVCITAFSAVNMKINGVDERHRSDIVRLEKFNSHVTDQLAQINTKLDFIINKRLK